MHVIQVSTLAVEWIEIKIDYHNQETERYVSTLAVEWIEINTMLNCGNSCLQSPPSRWSGSVSYTHLTLPTKA